jgi:hypothetical protein
VAEVVMKKLFTRNKELEDKIEDISSRIDNQTMTMEGARGSLVD